MEQVHQLVVKEERAKRRLAKLLLEENIVVILHVNQAGVERKVIVQKVVLIPAEEAEEDLCDDFSELQIE